MILLFRVYLLLLHPFFLSDTGWLISILFFLFQVDTRPPVPIGCPTIVPATVELGVTGTVVSWDVPTATDLSGLPVTIEPSRQPNSFFLVGTTDVTYTFTDQAGNMAECLFRVIVSESKYMPPPPMSNVRNPEHEWVKLESINIIVFYVRWKDQWGGGGSGRLRNTELMYSHFIEYSRKMHRLFSNLQGGVTFAELALDASTGCFFMMSSSMLESDDRWQKTHRM